SAPPATSPLSLPDALPIFDGPGRHRHVGQELVVEPAGAGEQGGIERDLVRPGELPERLIVAAGEITAGVDADPLGPDRVKCLSIDRKSTRLNSSHVSISYA